MTMTFVRPHSLQLGLAVAGVALLGLSATGCNGTVAPEIPVAEAAADATGDRNKELVHRYLQAEHRGDVAAMDELMTDDFKQYGLGVNSVATKAQALESIRHHWEEYTIATGGKDSAIRLWSAELIKIIDLTGHADEIRSLAFSHDGKWLASGGRDGQTRLWDVPGTRLEATFGEYKGRVYGVAFSPDDTLLAAGGGDFTSGSVQLFDVANRKKLHTLEGYNAFVHSVAFSPDGSLLATGGGDWSVRVWRVSDGKPPMPPASAE